jgi:hypothetical protein
MPINKKKEIFQKIFSSPKMPGHRCECVAPNKYPKTTAAVTAAQFIYNRRLITLSQLGWQLASILTGEIATASGCCFQRSFLI